MDFTWTLASGQHHYQGQILEDPVKMVRHGHGRMTFPNGKTYVGSWEHDHYSGYGVMLYPGQPGSNGNRYEGNWKNSLPHGYGCLTWDVGHSCCGYWEDGRFVTGNCTWKGQFLVSPKRSEITDKFTNWEQEPDNLTRDREWTHLVYLTDGTVYTGWLCKPYKKPARQPDGSGTKTYSDGATYTGQWLVGKRNGWGQLKCRAGTYTGSWHNDLPYGTGELKTNAGLFLNGTWVLESLTATVAFAPAAAKDAENDAKSSYTEFRDWIHQH
ncbi:hypothetical protein FACS189472_02270 [Alphaproteobacteria bacterium]|nr:hypothetical protein FACS189472_02270 [Alphaproteobacteria bacterium]